MELRLHCNDQVCPFVSFVPQPSSAVLRVYMYIVFGMTKTGAVTTKVSQLVIPGSWLARTAEQIRDG